jgi:glycosyltransferase involved in cell wall biosynthesis
MLQRPPSRGVVIVHDYVTQRGGAERVVLSLLKAFPNSPLITSFYHPQGTFEEFRNYDVRPLIGLRAGMIQRDPRLAFPLLPYLFSRAKVRDADLVIVSSSGWAHGIDADVPKLVYCHNTPRWLYQPAQYLIGQPWYAHLALRVSRPWLRGWDRSAAASATRYVANSRCVADRIFAAYGGMMADVVPPPVRIDATGDQDPIPGIRPGYLLTIARKRGYKNVEAICEAAEMQGRRLVVVGADPELAARYSGTIVISAVRDEQLRWLYDNCSAVVAASFEDFGLTPLEGNAFGRPAVTLRAGGFLDTLIEGRTGVYFDRPVPSDIATALERLDASLWDPSIIRAHARQYDEVAFISRMRLHASTIQADSALRVGTLEAPVDLHVGPSS